MVNINFGKCQTLGSDPQLISGFLSTLDALLTEATQSSILSIEFENFRLNFYKDPGKRNILFIIVVDKDDDQDMLKFKIKKISSLFFEQYDTILDNYGGNINHFNGFKDQLLEMNIAQKNCGERPECEGCPNYTNKSKILELYKPLQKESLQ